MRIELTWTSLSVPEADSLAGRSVVVIDALRATSTIVTALANGAAAIIPIRSVDEARREAASIPGALLTGERSGLKPDGFDLGNSPLEYTAGVVAGKTIVMTTTNGTRALSAAAGADEVICGSLLNAAAVARHVKKSGCRSLLVVCAGTDEQFSLDDALTAGAIIARLADDKVSLDDGATAALLLYRSREHDLPAAFRDCSHGRRLVELGLGEDVLYCSSIDTYDIVPVLVGRSILSFISPWQSAMADAL